MADPQVLNTLRAKRDQISHMIVTYEKRLTAARRDLSNVSAVIRLYEMDNADALGPAPYMDLSRLFKRGEIYRICLAAIKEEGPLDTRELSTRVVKAKGLDETDTVLRSSIGYRVVQSLSIACKRGALADGGRRKGIRVWRAL